MIFHSNAVVVEAKPRKAFISYAHAEEKWMQRLVEFFAPLKRDGILETWHDGMVLPGERWHPKILSALADADLVMILLSRAFLDSEYVRETELPLAVERAELGKCRLGPVILESCDWTKQPFAKFQALPNDRAPIAERSDVEHALNECLERLRWILNPPQSSHTANAPGTAVRAPPLLRLTLDFPERRWPDWSALLDLVRGISGNGGVRTSVALRTVAATRTRAASTRNTRLNIANAPKRRSGWPRRKARHACNWATPPAPSTNMPVHSP